MERFKEDEEIKITDEVLLNTNNKKHHGIVVSTELDLSEYLNESEMKSIAKKLFAEKLSKKVDEALEARSFGRSITDVILHQTVEEYTGNLISKYKDDLLIRIKEEIANTECDNEKYTLHDAILNKLNDVAYQYIDENLELIQDLMKNIISDIVKDISVNTISNMISRKINIEQILKDIIDNK